MSSIVFVSGWTWKHPFGGNVFSEESKCVMPELCTAPPPYMLVNTILTSNSGVDKHNMAHTKNSPSARGEVSFVYDYVLEHMFVIRQPRPQDQRLDTSTPGPNRLVPLSLRCAFRFRFG